jgi:serine/threonine protein kinase
MAEKKYNPFVNLNNPSIIQQNEKIGGGATSKLNLSRLSIVDDENIQIILKEKALKQVDLLKYYRNFQQEVKVLRHLNEHGNKYAPHLFNSYQEGNKGIIEMEKVNGVQPLIVNLDESGFTVFYLAELLAKAIHETYKDGAVNIDPGVDSFRIRIDRKGKPVAVKLVDFGNYFIVKNNKVTVDSDLIGKIFSLAPELVELMGKNSQSKTVDGKKLAVQNLGYSLASLLARPILGMNLLNSYNMGQFDRKRLEVDMDQTAFFRKEKPINFNSEKVKIFIDLIEDMLSVDPEKRPHFEMIFKRLRKISDGTKPTTIVTNEYLEKAFDQGLSPDREHVIDENVMEGLLSKLDQLKGKI